MSRYECIYNITPCGTSIGISIWDISPREKPNGNSVSDVSHREMLNGNSVSDVSPRKMPIGNSLWNISRKGPVSITGGGRNLPSLNGLRNQRTDHPI
jgi:hypothetical protein